MSKSAQVHALAFFLKSWGDLSEFGRIVHFISGLKVVTERTRRESTIHISGVHPVFIVISTNAQHDGIVKAIVEKRLNITDIQVVNLSNSAISKPKALFGLAQTRRDQPRWQIVPTQETEPVSTEASPATEQVAEEKTADPAATNETAKPEGPVPEQVLSEVEAKA